MARDMRVHEASRLTRVRALSNHSAFFAKAPTNTTVARLQPHQHRAREVSKFEWQHLVLALAQCLYVVKLGWMIDPYPDMAVLWLFILSVAIILPYHIGATTMPKRQVGLLSLSLSLSLSLPDIYIHMI